MYFKGPIWSTKVHKVLQSEKKKACVLQWITKHENSCPKGQKFSFYESTKTHQVFQSERKKANVLQWIHKVKTSCPKGHQWSTKVHQPDPLKYTSVAGSTKVHQPDPLKYTSSCPKGLFVGSLKYTSVAGSSKVHQCTLISLINVKSYLPILENSTLQKTKIPPACLLILLQKYVVKQAPCRGYRGKVSPSLGQQTLFSVKLRLSRGQIKLG